MNKEIKSLYYAFVSRNIEVYIPDEKENIFLTSKLFCAKCGTPWYTALQECFFCGEINYYVYICDNCKSYISITASNIKKKNINEGKDICPICRSISTLGQFCINEHCLSNTNIKVHYKVKKTGGIFMKDSPFSLSLMHCIECGNPSNYYKSFLIYVEVIENLQNNEKLNEKSISYCKEKNVDFIVVKIIDGENVYYDVKSLRDMQNPISKISRSISRRFSNIDELVNYVFQ